MLASGLPKAGRLTLTGVSERVKQQLDRTGTTNDSLDEANVFMATPTMGEASRHAIRVADEWLRTSIANEGVSRYKD